MTVSQMIGIVLLTFATSSGGCFEVHIWHLKCHILEAKPGSKMQYFTDSTLHLLEHMIGIV
jgi:hypothetical protein